LAENSALVQASPPNHPPIITTPTSTITINIMAPKKKEETGDLMVSIEQYTKTRDSVRTTISIVSCSSCDAPALGYRVAITPSSHGQRALLRPPHHFSLFLLYQSDRLVYATQPGRFHCSSFPRFYQSRASNRKQSQ
jgi:hypothetical protein